MEEGQDRDVVSECLVCECDTMHEVIKRKSVGSGEDVLVKCTECDTVRTVNIRAPRLVKVSTTISDGNKSSSVEVEADEDEEISVGDVFDHDGVSWRVTRIDDSDSRPKDALLASGIFSMWAVRSDKTVVGITMTDGEFSESSKIEFEPEREFSCGSIMVIGDERWRIRAIHTGRGRTLTGSRYAHEIRRIYLHRPE